MKDALSEWSSAFNGLSVISNREILVGAAWNLRRCDSKIMGEHIGCLASYPFCTQCSLPRDLYRKSGLPLFF